MPKWYKVLAQIQQGTDCYSISRNLHTSLSNVYIVLYLLEDISLAKREKVKPVKGKGKWMYMWYATKKGRAIINALKGVV